MCAYSHLDEELPFAGHPTLGTAYIIQREIIREEVPQIVLNLPVGPIPVKITYRNGEPEIVLHAAGAALIW
jgi:trans-2,3-dihydro-3-hydroxyanthranilate isomerase